MGRLPCRMTCLTKTSDSFDASGSLQNQEKSIARYGHAYEVVIGFFDKDPVSVLHFAQRI